MKFDLYTDVALKCEAPEHRLRRGDIVKLVDHHMTLDGTEGYSIEALRQDEVLCARTLYEAGGKPRIEGTASIDAVAETRSTFQAYLRELPSGHLYFTHHPKTAATRWKCRMTPIPPQNVQPA